MAKRRPKSTAAAIADAMKRLTSCVRSGACESIEISTPGMEPIRIDKAAAERIRKNADELLKAQRPTGSPRPRRKSVEQTGGLFT